MTVGLFLKYIRKGLKTGPACSDEEDKPVLCLYGPDDRR